MFGIKRKTIVILGGGMIGGFIARQLHREGFKNTYVVDMEAKKLKIPVNNYHYDRK